MIRTFVKLVFPSISYDIVIRYCFRLKHYTPCFCTNGIHIAFKQFSEKANETFQYHNCTFLYFYRTYYFRSIYLSDVQHRPAFHIRSVQMSTERKMCCMESLPVTICTAPFLLGMVILYPVFSILSNPNVQLKVINNGYMQGYIRKAKKQLPH